MKITSLFKYLWVFCETRFLWSSCFVKSSGLSDWIKVVWLRADLSLSQHAIDVVISRNVLWPSIHNKFSYLYGSVSCLLWHVNVIGANEILVPSWLHTTVWLVQTSAVCGNVLFLKHPAKGTGVGDWRKMYWSFFAPWGLSILKGSCDINMTFGGLLVLSE